MGLNAPGYVSRNVLVTVHSQFAEFPSVSVVRNVAELLRRGKYVTVKKLKCSVKLASG